MALEGGSPLRRGDLEQVVQGGCEPARDLRREGARLADLVEGERDVTLPLEGRHDEADVAALVAMPSVGEVPADELAQAVLQTVDRLDGGGRIEEGLGQAPFGDVHQHAHAVGEILVHRPLGPQLHEP